MNIKYRKSKLWNLLKIFFPKVDMKHVWLTFGSTIWIPEIGITNDLIEHEKVHVKQQKNWYIALWWWFRYLISSKFRYSQELPAHQAQLDYFKGIVKSRNSIYNVRIQLAKSMSEFYKMCDYDTALRDLK